MRYLPTLYLDIHVRGCSCLGRQGLGREPSSCPSGYRLPPRYLPCCLLPELLCAGQAAGLRGIAPVLEGSPGGCLEGQSAETVHYHELILQESKGHH